MRRDEIEVLPLACCTSVLVNTEVDGQSLIDLLRAGRGGECRRCQFARMHAKILSGSPNIKFVNFCIGFFGTMPVVMTGAVSTPSSPGSPGSKRGPGTEAAMRDFIAKNTAEQIRQGNIQHSSRLASMPPVVDSVMDTEIAAVARAELAAASAARRAEEEATRKAEVKQYWARLKAKTTVVDDLMDTEAAAIARGRLAAESRARKAAEAAEIRRENEEMKERIKNVKSMTDTDITDEIAGAAREERAAAAMARRAAKIEKIKAENEAMKQRLSNTKARTDDDVLDDELAGGGNIAALRDKKAADSKDNKAAVAKVLKSENSAMGKRIANTHSKTDDGNGIQF